MTFIYALPAKPKARFMALTVSSPEAATDSNRCKAVVSYQSSRTEKMVGNTSSTYAKTLPANWHASALDVEASLFAGLLELVVEPVTLPKCNRRR